MDSFEFNKIAGATLAAMLTAMVVGQIASALVSVHELDENVYVVRGANEEMGPVEGAAGQAELSIAELLAQADPAAGEKVAKKCHACHDFEKGGPNKIGPNLWGVVERAVASHPGFEYSSELQSLGGNWTFERLHQFLANPRTYAPGTKMTFAGIKNPKDRADLIAWLRQQSDNPVPLPAVEAKAEPTTATDGAAAPAKESAAPQAQTPAAEEQPAAESAKPEAATSTEAPAATESTAQPEATATAQPEEMKPAESEPAETKGQAAPAAAPAPSAGTGTTTAEAPATTQQAAATEGPDLSALFAHADKKTGAKEARKCLACHSIEKGAKAKIGPNLWNVVDRPVASFPDYSYSDAMKKFGGDWTYERLFDYLQKPRSVVEGTKMAFPGVKDEQKLADLLLWLGDQSDNPVPPPQ
jgi:cytochrome c